MKNLLNYYLEVYKQVHIGMDIVTNKVITLAFIGGGYVDRINKGMANTRINNYSQFINQLAWIDRTVCTAVAAFYVWPGIIYAAVILYSGYVISSAGRISLCSKLLRMDEY